MHILRKNLIKSINYLMDNFPVVALIGARQVGKTTLLKELRPDAVFFDLEDRKDFLRISSGADLIFKEESPPYLFDEAQISDELFKAIRVDVDKNRKSNGRFLLSGSSSPELLKNLTESLAGRIAIVEIPTLSWDECASIEQSKFYSSLTSIDFLLKLKPRYSYTQILEFCFYGGYPEAYVNRKKEKKFELWLENYFKTYIDRDIRKLFPSLNLEVYRRLVEMLTFSVGDILNFSKFSRSLGTSQPTVKKYLDIMEGTFLFRQLRPYIKNVTKRIIKMPKGHLRDSGLTNFLLNINNIRNLENHHKFGRIWESFVIEQIIKGLNQNYTRFSYNYYRTSNKTEIDLILEGSFGLIPVEIKTSSFTDIKRLKNLSSFIKEHKCLYGIVINNGKQVFKLSEKIVQIPCSCL